MKKRCDTKKQKQSSSGYGKTDMNTNEQIKKQKEIHFTRYNIHEQMIINTNGNTVPGTDFAK